MKTICTYSGDVAGVNHAKPDFTQIQLRDRVSLVPEPTNAYDPQAILVMHPTAGKLGYIPRASTYGFHINELYEIKISDVQCFVVNINSTAKFPSITIACFIEM